MTQIAVYGYSFCAAARRAMELITRNILRYEPVPDTSQLSPVVVSLIETGG